MKRFEKELSTIAYDVRDIKEYKGGISYYENGVRKVHKENNDDLKNIKTNKILWSTYIKRIAYSLSHIDRVQYVKQNGEVVYELPKYYNEVEIVEIVLYNGLRDKEELVEKIEGMIIKLIIDKEEYCFMCQSLFDKMDKTPFSWYLVEKLRHNTLEVIAKNTFSYIAIDNFNGVEIGDLVEIMTGGTLDEWSRAPKIDGLIHVKGKGVIACHVYHEIPIIKLSRDDNKDRKFYDSIVNKKFPLINQIDIKYKAFTDEYSKFDCSLTINRDIESKDFMLIEQIDIPEFLRIVKIGTGDSFYANCTYEIDNLIKALGHGVIDWDTIPDDTSVMYNTMTDEGLRAVLEPSYYGDSYTNESIKLRYYYTDEWINDRLFEKLEDGRYKLTIIDNKSEDDNGSWSIEVYFNGIESFQLLDSYKGGAELRKVLLKKYGKKRK